MGVPVLNRGDLLLRLATSVDFPVRRLMIVNNGKDPSVLDALARIRHSGFSSRSYIHEVFVIQPSNNLGVAGSWNLMMRAAWPTEPQPDTPVPYIMIVGNDIQLTPGDLKLMHEATETGMGIGDGTPPAPGARKPVLILGNHGFSFFCLTDRAPVEIGFFDENIYPAYLEDCDYCRRISVAGAVAIHLQGIQAVHGEAPSWGSSTIHSDKRLEIRNTVTHARNFEYYRRKWGGGDGQEVFTHPFNDPTKDHRHWELDRAWRKLNAGSGCSGPSPGTVLPRSRRYSRKGMKAYYIWAPGFTNVCGGIKVLHRLCHELNEAGCRAYVTTPHVNPQWKTPFIDVKHSYEDFIAIYPEIVPDNPFNARHVVRYILYKQEKEYAPGEFIVSYKPAFNWLKLPEERILYLPVLECDIFTDPKLPREGRAFYFGKGVDSPRIPETNGLPQITSDMAHEPHEFAKVFQRLELLYCYDNTSAIADIARLCGCPVVIIPDGSFARDQYSQREDDLAGLGFGVAETEHAMATINSAAFHERYNELIRQFHVKLRLFIDLTQSTFVTSPQTVLSWGNDQKSVFEVRSTAQSAQHPARD